MKYLPVHIDNDVAAAVVALEQRLPNPTSPSPMAIIQTPTIVHTMNSTDINHWLMTYRNQITHDGIRLRDIRNYISMHQRHISACVKYVRQARKLDIDLLSFHRALTELIQQYLHDGNYPYDFKHVFARFVNLHRHTIWELPSIGLGVWSVDALTSKLTTKSFRPVSEHCVPRTPAVAKIARWAVERAHRDNGIINMKELVQQCFECCGVVYTTSNENARLKQFQTRNTFISPQESYRLAGVEVIQHGELTIPTGWEAVLQIYNIDPEDCVLPDMIVTQ